MSTRDDIARLRFLIEEATHSPISELAGCRIEVYSPQHPPDLLRAIQEEADEILDRLNAKVRKLEEALADALVVFADTKWAETYRPLRPQDPDPKGDR